MVSLKTNSQSIKTFGEKNSKQTKKLLIILNYKSFLFI